MTTHPTPYRPTRILLVTAALLMVPLLAMQLTREVAWGPLDFVVAGVLIAGTGMLYQLGARHAGNLAYRAAVGVGLGAALLLVWANLAVGVIGDESNPANLMYVGVLAVGIVGAVVARLKAPGMARALFAMAVAMGVVAAVVLAFGLDAAGSTGPGVLARNGIFAALFAGSGLLFRRAAAGGLAD